MGQINSDLRPNSKTRTMNKLVLFLLVGFALISLSAGNEEDNEVVEIENTDMMELENMETLELAEPEAMSKKKKNKKKKGKKKNKKNRNKKNKKGRNKKNKKGRNKKNNSKGGRSGTRATSTCATNINKYLFYLAKAVVNFDKQLKRAGVQKNLAGKKSGKKGDYATALSSAQDAAGGNLSAPKCGSNSTNSGAMKLKEKLGNLSACSANIKKACSTGLPAHPNDTELAACKKKVQEYWWKMGNNTAKTDLCTAFGDNDTMAKYNAVKACITNNMTGNNMTIKAWATKVATARTACLKAFQQCRVSERAVGPAIQTCSKSSSAIVTSLNALQTNNASANTVKAKVKNLTSSSGRQNRAVPTTCALVVVVVKTFTVKLGQNPEADVKSETSDISGITLAAGSCSSIATELNGYVTTLDTIIAAIASKITILQAQLTTLTGSTASSSQIAAGSTASSSATTASGRKRRASLLKILNKVNMH